MYNAELKYFEYQENENKLRKQLKQLNFNYDTDGYGKMFYDTHVPVPVTPVRRQIPQLSS